MRKQSKIAKVVALLALFAIILWVVGTGALILFSPTQTPNVQPELTEEKLDEILEQYQGEIKTWDMQWTGSNSEEVVGESTDEPKTGE